MIVSQASLNALRVSFNKGFQQGMRQATTPVWQKFATRFPSGGRDNIYGWLQRFPQFREWIGRRSLRNITEKVLTVRNRKFETTVNVARTDIEDDNLGVYGPIVMTAGEEAMLHVDRGTTEAMQEGHVLTCYDGQPYFSDAHQVAAEVDGTGAMETMPNAIWGSPGAVSEAEANTGTGSVAVGGEVYGYSKWSLRCTVAGATGTAAFRLSQDGVEDAADIVSSGNGYTIPNEGIEITWDDGATPADSFDVGDTWSWEGSPIWMLLYARSVIKPFIYQDRMAPEIEAVMNTQQDHVFMEDEYLFGARARRAFSVAFWQMAAASTKDLTEANFNELYQLVQLQQWDGRDPCGFTPNLLVCGPRLRAASKQAVDMMLVDQGKSNVNYQAAESVCTPWIKR